MIGDVVWLCSKAATGARHPRHPRKSRIDVLIDAKEIAARRAALEAWCDRADG